MLVPRCYNHPVSSICPVLVRRTMAVALVLAGAAAGPRLPAAAQNSLLGPGKYEGTVEVSIAGEAQPPQKDEQCFTRADLDGLECWLATSFGDSCSVTDHQAAGRRATFAITCMEDAGRATTTRAELTTDHDAFAAVMHRTEDVGGEQLESTYSITARRVGDCSK